jgi:hypothetical protein
MCQACLEAELWLAYQEDLAAREKAAANVAREPFPVQLNREGSQFLEVAHVLVGEPVVTSPGHAPDVAAPAAPADPARPQSPPDRPAAPFVCEEPPST